MMKNEEHPKDRLKKINRLRKYSYIQGAEHIFNQELKVLQKIGAHNKKTLQNWPNMIPELP